MGLLVITVLFILLQFVASQDANCDFTQNVQPGQTYYIYNAEYPNNYTGARQCRWIGIAPDGYRLLLECPVIELPASQGCSMDRLLISKSGDPQLSGADVYCGRGSTTAMSPGQRISVGLITARTTFGGRFYCQLSAQQTTPTPTPCSCGYKKRNRIVGGVETGINEYPMMAGVIDLKISAIKCGGTIIEKRYVLTAAHCVVGRDAQEVAVVVGEHDITVGDSPATQGINVQQITTHPQFSSSNYDYDIAILRLAEDITFSDLVGPACLPFKFVNTNLTGAIVTLLGWGTLCPGCPTSKTLQKVDVQVVSQSSCQSVVSSLTSRQMCTYARGKDACQDDSGGPVLYTEPSTGTIFGVGAISYGNFCATEGQPGINTRVTALLTWIQNNTPGASYCRK
ncbi:venom serine protease-like isoform X2 [Choristoneura fumiferana]